MFQLINYHTKRRINCEKVAARPSNRRYLPPKFQGGINKLKFRRRKFHRPIIGIHTLKPNLFSFCTGASKFFEHYRHVRRFRQYHVSNPRFETPTEQPVESASISTN